MKKVLKKIDWKKGNGLVPAIIQDAVNMRVLMLGYMNKEALKKTVDTGNIWFFSRSKERLWMKGEVSGNVLKLIDLKVDCDGDSLVFLVEPTGPTCHTGGVSCFEGDAFVNPVVELFEVIESRKLEMPSNSYTTQLLKKGVDKICAKIGEESGEVIKAAQKESDQRLIEESVDLFYHMLVLLVSKGVKLSQFLAEIGKRRK